MNPSAIICEDWANKAFVEWRVLIKGRLRKLQRASFVEPEVLEVKGSCGILRLEAKPQGKRDYVQKFR